MFKINQQTHWHALHGTKRRDIVVLVELYELLRNTALQIYVAHVNAQEDDCHQPPFVREFHLERRASAAVAELIGVQRR